MGGAGEFADYRQYSPGDDLRRLDWRVLGRTGRAYVKQFQEDTNLTCLPVIDCSGSMQFDGHPIEPKAVGWFKQRLAAATPSLPRSERVLDKLEYAQYFTSALTHLVTRGGDSVGLGMIGDDLIDYRPPGSTPTHTRGLYEAIENIQTVPRTNLAAGLDALMTSVRGRGVMLLISDFLVDDLSELTSVLRRVRHRGWEIVALHLVHPAEESLPPGVAYQFEGMEGEPAVRCRVEEVRDLYDQRWREHLERTRNVATAVGANYHRISTATHYLDTLGDFLVQRAG